MADYSMMMSQSEISALKDTLCAQQKLLQKLYNELDAEREASATAASEALSVILRLQGEKAAVKMEAEQYKRLAEEKMCHAEESFAIIEDIIYQKEMEVAALDYQVQAYRYKLLSMGCVDPGGGELKFPENLLQRNENVTGDTSFHHLGRRNSAPLLLKYKKAMIERENSTSPDMDLSSKTVEEQTGQELNDVASDLDKKMDSSTHGGIISYGEEIRKLDILVKEIAGANYVSSRNESRSPSLSSRPSAGNLYNLSNSANLQNEIWSPPPQVSIGSPYDPAKNPANLVKKGVAVDYPCSPSVHDVFEVPQVDQKCCTSYESSTKDKKKMGDESLESEDVVKPYAKDEPDWLKKLLQSTHRDRNLCKPSDVAAIDRSVIQPATSVAESQRSLNQVNRGSRISEVERVAESNYRGEELKLLKEIKEQLNLLQDEIRSQKVNKSCDKVKSSLCPLPEAMLHFWL